jgi:hypothetical protein
MLRSLTLAALAALLFYGVLPVAGAFAARAVWRAFRRRFLASLGYAPLSLGDGLRIPDGEVRVRRHSGSAEVLQGEDRLWVRGEGATAAVLLTDARIFLLPTARTSEGPYDLEAADESLQPAAWNRLSGLSEGARVYAAGNLRIEGGLPVFFGTPGEPLLILIHDGRDGDLARRAVWAGRHRNEYWNPVTLVSLTAGFLSTGAALYDLLRPPSLSLPAALAAALAVSPVLPFLPPGLAFLSLYRRLWSRARRLRAHRDLLRAGLEGPVGDAGPRDAENAAADCAVQARRDEILAGLALAAALALNFLLAVLAVRGIIR